MNLSSLKPALNARRKNKRKGRGPGSHLGKTCGKGMNGARSRSGTEIGSGFEGGQLPLQRRLPKRGFKSPNPIVYQVVNLVDLEKKCEGDVTPDVLFKLGITSNRRKPVKILGKGSLNKTLKVSAHAFSASARQAIEAAKGEVEVL